MLPKNSRHHVLVFTLVTLILSWSYETYIIFNGGVKAFGLGGLVLLMWIPGLVSIAYRALSKIGFGDTGFKLGHVRFFLVAAVIPVILALLTNLVSVPLGMKSFLPIPIEKLAQAIPQVIVILMAGIFGAFGEELGWRGFLVPKLIESGYSRPYLISGIIWALWHLPLVALGGYYSTNAPVLIAIVYTASIISMTFVISELRMRSGSLWVATTMHVSHNFFFQLVFPFLIFSGSGPHADQWDLLGAIAALFPPLVTWLPQL